MKALLFLTTRSIKNGVKRAITTPRRLVSIVIFLGYYYLMFMRPAAGAQASASLRNVHLAAPPMEVLPAVIFGMFALLSLVMLVGVFSPLTGFRPADVDMLFATPVSPRMVLIFRIIRDFSVTLLTPLIMTLFAIRPASAGWSLLFRNMPHPEASSIALRMITVAWILMAMVWVSLTYAITLFTNRSDKQSDRNRKILGWTVGCVFGLVVLYIGYEYTQMQSARDYLNLADSPILRSVFFTASFATEMVMAPLTGDWAMGVLGVGGLVVLAAGAFYLALIQSGWMYDQAAAKGFSSIERRQLQQKGDMYAMVAYMAREGKLKPGKKTWIHRLKLKGPKALLWKDYFLQTRGMKFMVYLMMAIALFINIMPTLGSSFSRGGGYVILMMQGITVLMVTMSFAQTGFLEFIRRVDLQKPLPFSSGTSIFMEVLAKSLLGIVATWLSSLVLLILSPEHWQFLLAAIIGTPAFALMISSVTLMLTLLFPDIDDPSQRTLRGMLQLLSIVILATPGVIIVALAVSLGSPILLAMLPAAVMNLALTYLICNMSGSLYAGYNPSD